jgi:hypothetical protein
MTDINWIFVAPKQKKTSLLILEKHCRRLVQHQSRLDQNGPNHLGEGA